MNMSKLCIDLLKAESEEKVQIIIDSSPKMSNPLNWYPLDKRETNQNVVRNQARTGAKAAAEIMVNMVDAMLMKAAYEKGIDPKDPEKAPKNMYAAVDELIHNLHGGKLIYADDDHWLKEYDKNLVIGVTGCKESNNRNNDVFPCYTFVDNGEGQRAQDFETTFLSLSEKNKRGIPFVQGKFNMGSAGVLNYCGTKWFKLIISRRYDKSHNWGWTLIRLRPNSPDNVAEYFKYKDNIPEFDEDYIYPFVDQDDEIFKEIKNDSGTIVKLYDYNIGRVFKDFKGARNAFSENLVESILPFRIYDFRQKKDKTKGHLRARGIDSRPFYGLEYLLCKKYSLEDIFSEDSEYIAGKPIDVGDYRDPELGYIQITAVPLKKLPEYLEYSRFRVFHHVNGQVHYKNMRGYLTSRGLSELKDRVVIFVDASNLSVSAHSKIWKADREDIIEHIPGERYKKAVDACIENKKSPLFDWKNSVRKELLTKVATDEAKDLFEELIKIDRDFVNLLSNRDPNISFHGVSDSKEEEYKGKYSPTYFSVKIPRDGKPLEIAKNRTAGIIAETDVENEYFTRLVCRGELYVSDKLLYELFSVNRFLKNGIVTIFVTPKEERVRANQKFECEIGLYDAAMPQPVSSPVTIVVTEEEEVNKRKEHPPRPEKPKREKETPKYSLPGMILLTKDGRDVFGNKTENWPEWMTELDGGYCDSDIYYINLDNSHFAKYRMKIQNEADRDLLTQKYITAMRIMMLTYNNSLNKAKTKEQEELTQVLNNYDDDLVKIASRAAASAVMWLTDKLPQVVSFSNSHEEEES